MMHALSIASLWLHIVAVATWFGGMAFLALVVVPVTRRPEYQDIAAGLIKRTGVRFRTIGWACLGLIIATGVANLWVRGTGWETLADSRFWRTSYGGTLGAKLGCVAAILVLSLIHDAVVGPRATIEWQRASTRAFRMRRAASWLGRSNLLLGLLVVLLAIMLGRGAPW